ncbi:unnamed protein product [Amoebophrya sp. A120]|nr:unnamed protein product [Amoebophrya sp. A120]|eukprot:GSA120T00005609001.1
MSSSSSTAPFGVSSKSTSSDTVEFVRKKTFSDLLVSSGGLSFDEWIGALEHAEEEFRALRFQKKVVGSLVNMWQFCVFHANPKITFSQKLPEPVVDIIRKFNGQVKYPGAEVVSRATLCALSDAQRGRDYKKAADYLVGICREAALTGSDTATITEEAFALAPKLADGSVPGTRQVFAVIARKGYQILDGAGFDSDNYRFGYRFPYTIRFNYHPAKTENCEMIASFVDQLENREGLYAPAIEEGQKVSKGSSELPNHFLKLLGESYRATQKEVLEYIVKLVEKAAQNADHVFLLSEEIYEEAPRLANGKRYPMFEHEMQGLHLSPKEFTMFSRLSNVPGLSASATHLPVGFGLGQETFPIEIFICDA